MPHLYLLLGITHDSELAVITSHHCLGFVIQQWPDINTLPLGLAIFNVKVLEMAGAPPYLLLSITHDSELVVITSHHCLGFVIQQ